MSREKKFSVGVLFGDKLVEKRVRVSIHQFTYSQLWRPIAISLINNNLCDLRPENMKKDRPIFLQNLSNNNRKTFYGQAWS